MRHLSNTPRRGSSPDSSRRDFLKRWLGVAVCGVGCQGRIQASAYAGEARRSKTRELSRWQPHLVAKIPHGYQVAVADVNGDGRPDILALSSQESIVEWYENSTWKPHPIATGTKRNISLSPLGQRGFGLRGLALATDFALEDSTRGGSVWWVQPPAPGVIGCSASRPESAPPEKADWLRYLIAQIPTSHRLRWADLDGDGRPELLDAPIVGPAARAPDYNVGTPLTWFEPPEEVFVSGGGPHFRDESRAWPWAAHRIDDSLTVVHGVQVLDWEGDGRDEILTASSEGVHLFHSLGRGPNLAWKKVQLAAGKQSLKPSRATDPSVEAHRGSSEIGVGRIGGRRFLATIEPWHGEQVVVYFEAKQGQLWSRQVIDESLRDGHALACADLDADGNDEIVAGFRGPGTSLYVYWASGSSALGTPAWERQTLDTEMAASGVVIDDINGDGRLDVVAIGASTGNVKWYENLGSGAERPWEIGAGVRQSRQPFTRQGQTFAEGPHIRQPGKDFDGGEASATQTR